MKLDNIERTYIVHLPKSYSVNETYSLVFNFHGLTDSASGQETYSGMDLIADLAGFIVVYPNAIAHSWNVGFYGSYSKGVNDVGFVSAMIDTLSAKYKIDSRRVYACGWSDGGYMCYRLACQLSNRIAAIASVCGLMTDSMVANCQNSCPVPVMDIHGTKDPEVPYYGNASGHGSLDSVIQYWINKDNCSQKFVETDLQDIDKSDSCAIEKYVYSLCSDSSEVRKYEVVGGGHTWPGGPFLFNYIGHTNRDINGSAEIWEFFQQHRLQCGIRAGIESSNISTHISYYPSPFINELHVTIEDQELHINRVSLNDIYGRQVYCIYRPGKNYFTIPTGDYPPGTYFLKIDTYSNVLFKPVIKVRQ